MIDKSPSNSVNLHTLHETQDVIRNYFKDINNIVDKLDHHITRRLEAHEN